MNIWREFFGKPLPATKPSGKPIKREVEAAAEFVLSVCQHVPAQWPSICQGLQSFDPYFESLRDDKVAAYEFVLAVIAVEMHTIGFLPSDQAGRIRSQVLECLTTKDVGNYPRQAVAEYDAAWNSSISQEELPLFGVASVLYDKLGLSSHATVGSDTFKDPLVLSALVDAIVRLGGPWWRKYIERNQIVAS